MTGKDNTPIDLPGNAIRVLIVDDDESVRDVISVLLREEGYTCIIASGAEQALELVAQEETPLVISDTASSVPSAIR